MPGNVQLIGVYTLPVNHEMIAEQAQILYGDDAAGEEFEQVREQLESTVLVEVLVSNADADFDVGDFAQEDPQQPRENWQASWAEALLSPDGERLLVVRGDPLPPDQANFRVAFYLHYWKPGQPLVTSYGRVPTTPPSMMPERLTRLVPYELVD
jgi:hypothetical protein